MSWAEHAICWHVYPLGFLGAPIRDRDAQVRDALTHRLLGLVAWLDYMVELGASALLLGPIFDSSTHGYDTLDHYRIDPRLGDETDFDSLVRECHERGLKVILDGVFNHVGAAHPAFGRALAGGPGGPEAALFRIDFDAPGGPRPADFEGHGDLVALDHESPAVLDFVADVMAHWCARGADGWRLDAAYAVAPEFWAQVLARVRASHPEVFVVGEVIHGDYVQLVEDSGWDSLTQYELWKAIWSSLKDGNFHELAHALGRHEEFLHAFVPMTFVGNHDVTRIASQVGADKAALAAVLLLSLPGIPSIYAGDEQGYTGVKEDRLGGDDDVRPLFPANPEELSDLGSSMHRVYQELIGVRRRHSWLHDAVVEVTSLSNEAIAYVCRERAGEAQLLVELDSVAGSARISSGEQALFVLP
ncbi:MAG: alpha-amylase family protein [Micrococcales bacterium]|nr:alpha-amylase family protein [Micrococcales bacterium]